ncbi:MAG: DUF6843 domain-containing protein [Bacteroidia bacterium]
MFQRKLSLIDKIILIGVVAFVAFILGFWWNMKRSNKDFHLPANFSGWANIRYSVPNAQPLVKKAGIYQIYIPPTGMLETSTALEDGWGRDQFFDETGKLIPNSIGKNQATQTRFHLREYGYRSFLSVLAALPKGKDSTFYEGTQIYRSPEGKEIYHEGEKSVETFYVSSKFESVLFNPPANPDSNNIYITPLRRKMMKER